MLNEIFLRESKYCNLHYAINNGSHTSLINQLHILYLLLTLFNQKFCY